MSALNSNSSIGGPPAHPFSSRWALLKSIRRPWFPQWRLDRVRESLLLSFSACHSRAIFSCATRAVRVCVLSASASFCHRGETCQPRAGPSLKTSRVAAQKYKTNGLTLCPPRTLGRHDPSPSHFPRTRVYLFPRGASKGTLADVVQWFTIGPPMVSRPFVTRRAGFEPGSA